MQNNTSFTVIIPARYASSRLPGKPLMDIGGKSMVQHVYERAQGSDASQVIIATDHEEIKVLAESFGADVCMTREDHESGTDRLQEVDGHHGLSKHEIIVNVQGDEPLIPAVINRVATLLTGSDYLMATLYENLTQLSQIFDPNVVKLVSNLAGEAMVFSRAAIPWHRDRFPDMAGETLLGDYKRHIGLYAYKVDLLNQFVNWPVSHMESIEKLEQLRVLEHGIPIAVAKACDDIPVGVDTMEDLLKIREIISSQSP